jgi:L-histidine N-alpha-methyltransferase
LEDLRRSDAVPRVEPGHHRPGLDEQLLCSFLEDATHRRSLLDGIAGGSVPLKFAYAGSAAYTHCSYAETTDYVGTDFPAKQEFTTLIESGMCAGGIADVVEVGPGDGVRTVDLLEHLRGACLGVSRYLALDFSATLLDLVGRRVRERIGLGLGLASHVWDMEDATPSPVVERWRSGDSPVLTCLLGHTLGNLEDPAQAMRNLAALLRPGDLLLASVLLRPPSAPMSDGYHTEAFRRAALEPMVAAGIALDDMKFSVEYRDHAFIGEVTLLHGTRLGDTVLPPGHTFRCFMSRRFDGNSVVRLFEQSGWLVPTAIVDQGGDHMTIVASRTEELR